MGVFVSNYPFLVSEIMFKELSKLDLVVVGGKVASGKTFVLRRFFGDRVLVEKDEIRKCLGKCFGLKYTFNKDFEDIVNHFEKEVISRNLKEGNLVAVSALMYTKRLRESYIKLAKSLGKKVGLIFLNCDVEKAVGRDAGRFITIGERAIRHWESLYQKPELKEGLSRIVMISTNKFRENVKLNSLDMKVALIKKGDDVLKKKSGEFHIADEVWITPAIKFGEKGKQDDYLIAKIYDNRGEKLKKVRELMKVYGGATELGWTGIGSDEQVWKFPGKSNRAKFLNDVKKL